MNLPNYFLQTNKWLTFWKKASGLNHGFKFFEDENYFAYIYEYPWKFKQKFWYLPKGPILKTTSTTTPINKEQVALNLKSFLEMIILEAKKNNIAFIKLDFDDNLTKALEYNQENTYFKFLKDSFKNLLIINETKKIQYLQSTIYDLGYSPKNDLETDTLKQFWDQNQAFWSKTNEQVRRYTKKIIKEYELGEYYFSFEKNDENFKAFWDVHYLTTQRQDFSTQSREYLHEMMQQKFGFICIVYNKNKEPLSVFLGIMLDGVLYYILGGNTEEAMQNRTQYLLQLLVIRQARLKGCTHYDMGGYEAGSGYSKFKDGYRGKIRKFLGPIDIVLKPITYKNIQASLKIYKHFKKLLNNS